MPTSSRGLRSIRSASTTVRHRCCKRTPNCSPMSRRICRSCAHRRSLARSVRHLMSAISAKTKANRLKPVRGPAPSRPASDLASSSCPAQYASEPYYCSSCLGPGRARDLLNHRLVRSGQRPTRDRVGLLQLSSAGGRCLAVVDAGRPRPAVSLEPHPTRPSTTTSLRDEQSP